MAVVFVDNEDIIRGEDRWFQFYYVLAGTTTQAPLPTGAAAFLYELRLSHVDNGTTLITKSFGAAEFDAGTERWNVKVPAASTTLLSAGYVCYGRWWRVDTGSVTPIGQKMTFTVGG
jgi:hypothetical protein